MVNEGLQRWKTLEMIDRLKDDLYWYELWVSRGESDFHGPLKGHQVASFKYAIKHLKQKIKDYEQTI